MDPLAKLQCTPRAHAMRAGWPALPSAPRTPQYYDDGDVYIFNKRLLILPYLSPAHASDIHTHSLAGRQCSRSLPGLPSPAPHDGITVAPKLTPHSTQEPSIAHLHLTPSPSPPPSPHPKPKHPSNSTRRFSTPLHSTLLYSTLLYSSLVWSSPLSSLSFSPGSLPSLPFLSSFIHPAIHPSIGFVVISF